MNNLNNQLKNVEFPEMIKIKQNFSNKHVNEPDVYLHKKITENNLIQQISSGDNIAIPVGSRGIKMIVPMLKKLISLVKKYGGRPFIVPAMGSHGGATAKGQLNVLKKLGITEKIVGAPIYSSMDTVLLGYSDNGLPVYIDKYVAQSDGIILLNRVKPHTSFRGNIESGLRKMLVIGVGKQKGASICHKLGFEKMEVNIKSISDVIIDNINIIIAAGIIENAYGKIYDIEVMDSNEITEREPELLEVARSQMSKILFSDLDILIIDEIGKDISGTGMDTNVTGRYHTYVESHQPNINKIVVLDLTEKSDGNANGIGLADYTTQKAKQKISLEKMYMNAITSTVPLSVKIPMTLDSSKFAIAAAIKTANLRDKSKIRLIKIKNTSSLDQIYISKSLISEIEKNNNLEIIGDLENFKFDKKGEVKNLK